MFAHTSIIFLVALCVLSLTCAFNSVSAQEIIEPSDQETLMLDFINRYRSNPAREIDRILAGVESGISGMGSGLDVEACYDAVAKIEPAPPLVFNLKLLRAARNHARYMINSRRTGHFEQAGNPGYTGDTPLDRIKACGYEPRQIGENAFRNAVSVWNSHRGFIIDWGDGPGGMQDPPGHRIALSYPKYKEIGCAFVPFDGGKHGSTVHNFGLPRDSNKRFLGGIVFSDLNRNDAYDVGEGLSLIPLKASGAYKQTWSSGAFTMEIAHTATQLEFTVDGKTYVHRVAAGAENAYVHCIAPQKGDHIYLFKHVEQFKKHEHKMTRAIAINMWLRTRGYYRNPELEALLAKHCAAYADEFQQDKAVLMPVYYAAKPQAFAAVLAMLRKKWIGSDAGDFFKDAEKGFAVYYSAHDLIETIRRREKILVGRLEETIESLVKTQAEIKSQEIKQTLKTFEIMLTRSVRKK